MRIHYFRSLTTLLVGASLAIGALGQTKGFDTSNMDRTADACDNFFQFADGNWVRTNEIPASQPRWGTFNILAESNRDVLKAILDDASSKKSPVGSDPQLIGDFYASCMNEAAIDKAGITPLDPYFKQIAKIKTIKDVENQIAVMHSMGVPAVFRVGGGADLKNSSMVIVNAGQGGLTLPNRDYYTNTDAKSVETRAKFVEYMTNMFKLAGDAPAAAAANAATVMEMQTRLANASLAPVDLRDPDKNYNKIAFTAAQEIIPNFSLTDYMTARGLPSVTEINLGQPGFFKEVNSMLKDVPVANWKTYFRWMLLNSAAPELSKPFVEENFNFFGRTLNGTKEQLPRWKRCVQSTDRNLGEALGMVYVKTKFTPAMKARMDEMIDNLFAAFRARIGNLGWMSDETKAKALVKLNAFKRKIGYPDKLRGYKGLTITRNSYIQNDLNINKFQVKRNADDIGKPVDRTRWGFTPPTVNASYSSVNNDITFPAGILQPPFFNFAADDAINYGGIGGVIGHEVTHGFDDQGSKFDAEGNLKSWWTPDDRKKFEERASCVADQFSGYEVQPGLNINGRLTLGENIGDFGGLTVAYDAFMKSLEGKPRPADIDGFTPEQRFFLGWAQVWAAKATPEFERLQVKTDPHSAAQWRVNGPLSNMPRFAKAFGCKEGDKMVRKNACLIW